MTDKLKDWDTTAANNNSTPPNGWPENMAPSDVNDTARQGMASVAEWYDDAEWLHYGHTASAYTSTTLTISGDVTAKYVAGRKIRLDQDNSKVAKVESSSYGAPNTTVTVSGYTIAALPSIVELHLVSDEDYLPIIPPIYPDGYITGLRLSSAADTDHDITLAVGGAKDSTDAVNMELATAITKQIDNAASPPASTGWQEGDNENGFPSGVNSGVPAANTWYYVFLISKTDGTVDAGFDSSSTAANLLADASTYTYYRHIGSVLTDGSSNILAVLTNEDIGKGYCFVDIQATVTFPKPPEVDYLTRVICYGAGGGGSSGGGSGTDGTDSAFDGMTLGGGDGATSSVVGDGGLPSSITFDYVTKLAAGQSGGYGSGGSPANSGEGGECGIVVSSYSGGSALYPTITGGAATANGNNGGGGGGASTVSGEGGGGGAAIVLENYPISGSISVTIGAGGTGNGSGGDGGDGRCKIWI